MSIAPIWTRLPAGGSSRFDAGRAAIAGRGIGLGVRLAIGAAISRAGSETAARGLIAGVADCGAVRRVACGASAARGTSGPAAAIRALVRGAGAILLSGGSDRWHRLDAGLW